LHGIDAWRESSSAGEELSEVRRVTGRQEIGTRMHWLYFNEQSPDILDSAGFSYDSTVGYCETIGYRAGTTQVYKPLGASRLLELPLHVMDTALFYPCYLNLSEREARQRVDRQIGDTIEFGGSLTLNWHDRSIAPERLWDEFYVELIAAFKAQGAWLATAEQTVAWFRKRRAAVFDEAGSYAFSDQLAEKDDDLPDLQVRRHGETQACPSLVPAPDGRIQ
jgi:hypothetical protein